MPNEIGWSILLDPCVVSGLAVVAIIIAVIIFFIQLYLRKKDRIEQQTVDSETQKKLQNIQNSVDDFRKYENDTQKKDVKSGGFSGLDVFLVLIIGAFLGWLISQMLPNDRPKK